MSIQKFKDDFKAAADVFKKMFVVFNPDTKNIDREINSGDCGVFALAVGSVLSDRGHDFSYVDNLNYGFIQFVDEDGVSHAFDSANYDGCSIADMNERWQAAEGTALDFKGMCDAYVPCDVKGAYMIKVVLDSFEVPVPTEIQTIFANELDYEIDIYVNKYRGAAAIALAKIKGQ
ncbi:hypothetical protein TOTORO_00880 [Serratia phage vB_SmaS-Totoro]|nr:hypothetical protein TOTORO_00880 [Serratia phage vB_SmaS-Totoro]